MSKSFPTFSLSSLPFPLILLMLWITSSEASEVIGHADGVVVPGTYDADPYIIRGWTCQAGDSRSTSVHVYLGKKASKGGTFLKEIVADKSSELGVGAACGTPGGNFRFEVPISNEEALAYGGEKVYVYGLSTMGTGNLILDGGRGDFKVPTGIHGEITEVGHRPDRTGYIFGWTCQVGIKESLTVKIFLGGTATGGGEDFKIVWARSRSLSRAAAVACDDDDGFVYHAFFLKLETFERAMNMGKSVYVYALSWTNKSRVLLAKSGDFVVV